MLLFIKRLSFGLIVAHLCLQFSYWVVQFLIWIGGGRVRGKVGFLHSNNWFVSFFLWDHSLIGDVVHLRVSTVWRYRGVHSSFLLILRLRNGYILCSVLQRKIKRIALVYRNRFWCRSWLALGWESRVIGLLLLIWAWCGLGLRSLLGLLWNCLLLLLTLWRLCCYLSGSGSAVCAVWWVCIILVRKSIHVRVVSWGSRVWQIRCIFGLFFESSECNHIE